MGIARMNKVYLLAHQADKEHILSALQQSGLLEISDITGTEEEDWATSLTRDQEQEALQELEGRLAEVKFNLDFLNRYHPVRKGLLDDMLAEKKSISAGEMEQKAAGWAEVSSKVFAAIKAIDEQLLQIRNEETRLQNLRQQLFPWRYLPVPLERLKSTPAVKTELFSLPANVAVRLREELAETDTAYYLEEVENLRGEIYFVLVTHHSDAETVREVLKRFDYVLHAFPELTGLPEELLAGLEEDLQGLSARQEEVMQNLAELVQYREQLLCYLDYLTVLREKKQAVENLGRTARTFVLEGWIRQADVERLKLILAGVSDSVEMVVREPEPGEAFPVLLENKPLFAPFEFVTKLYGAPSPAGVDPTAAFTPFFIVFFGIALTDAAYGVFLSLLAVLGLMKIKGENMRKLLKIIFACGLSTVVFGWLIGGWLGYQVLGAPLYFDSLSDPMRLLVYSLALGVIHIFWGMMVKLIHLVRRREYFAAFADVVLWYGLIIGLLLLIVPAAAQFGKYLALASAVGLVLTQGRAQSSLIKKFFSGVLSLYNITGYLSDILSYSRLLALGLATGVVSLTVNTMAGLLKGHPIGYVAMFILLAGGHVFNLAINALGAFIHSSRLQYIEFYNQFYEGGGKHFKPFRLQTRHIEIRPEGLPHK
ncbi:MAG TPA: V-type ATP synthase subunit I [Firmicutes bacterium]|nr:V-type ATP synthase subunit I [Bacillota bacterium]